jgi:hypothetical protein
MLRSRAPPLTYGKPLRWLRAPISTGNSALLRWPTVRVEAHLHKD